MTEVVTTDTQCLAPLLAQHEAVIERGLKSFIEVGEALAAIRDQRLYRATRPNFDAYLTDRWPELGGRNYAGKLIRAAKAAVELGTVVPNAAPSTEGQVRSLLRLKDPSERLAAWQSAGERAGLDGRREPTATDVEAAVRAVKEARAQGRREAADPPFPPQGERPLRAARQETLALGALKIHINYVNAQLEHLEFWLPHLQGQGYPASAKEVARRGPVFVFPSPWRAHEPVGVEGNAIGAELSTAVGEALHAAAVAMREAVNRATARYQALEAVVSTETEP
jgi:hypothetical protein